MIHSRVIRSAFLLICIAFADCAAAGMPAPLPTPWTADNPPLRGIGQSSAADDARWQVISFFVVFLLLCAWVVRLSWNAARRELSWLPPLGYGRALSLVVLWGFLFVIVLTMISGARELMTPGAWEKQGWTYRLADAAEASTTDDRRRALEDLRQALWHYAAMHAGRFPSPGDPAIAPRLWDVPGWSGLRFLCVPGQVADENGRLLAFEPELDGQERLVLLTNGFIGTMSTSDIESALEENGL